MVDHLGGWDPFWSTPFGCAEAVQQENYKAADVLIQQISNLAPLKAVLCGKLRILRRGSSLAGSTRSTLNKTAPGLCFLLTFSRCIFTKGCPYLRIRPLPANQACPQTFAGCRRVRIMEFQRQTQGMQWPP
ncbi:hypothetical protein HPP92_027736 [Vanilla planifolia]|uniref:Uncharacterized protein n=1 Tax=Vanilla planifolia TaxID=51239 RepID=A0A835P9X6_VANPL|nr:hypothetical protein HPP92_027736 [Vanilla planifolia]KAG0448701.1 hypothetical protein HPP92_027696 [Vanilla planifolia]